MTGRRRARRAALGLVCAAGCAAGNATLDARLGALGQLLIDAEQRGARHCAPRELAVARTHAELAEMERAQGYASKAERHLDLAEWNARAAERLSPPERCTASPVTSPGGSEPGGSDP